MSGVVHPQEQAVFSITRVKTTVASLLGFGITSPAKGWEILLVIKVLTPYLFDHTQAQ